MLINGVWEDNITCPSCKMRHPAAVSCTGAKAIARRAKEEREATTLDETQYCPMCEEAGKQLETANQRNLELLAVIEKQHELLSNALKYPAQRFEPSQALREHEAKVIEECAGLACDYSDRYGNIYSSDYLSLLRHMAEERRK